MHVDRDDRGTPAPHRLALDLDDSGIPPKSPPYRSDDTVDTFEPFGVGYVDLDGDLMVEARLTENDPGRLAVGLAMELVVVPLYRQEDGTDVLTYAFRPVEKAS